MQQLEVRWSFLKTAKSRDGFTFYYVATIRSVDSSGTSTLADYDIYGSNNSFIYHARALSLNGAMPGSDALDFETNYRAGAILVPTSDDALALIVTSIDDASVQSSAALTMIGGTDGTAVQAVAVDVSGRQKVTLYDVSGDTLDLKENTVVPANQGGAMVSGWDGTNSHFLKTDNAGQLITAPAVTAPNTNVYTYSELTTTAVTANQVILTYTVPANVTFYLVGYSMTRVDLTSTSCPAPFRLVANSIVLKRFAVDWNGGNGFGNYMIWSENYPYPFPVATAGQVIQITVTPSDVTSTTWGASILGIIK